MQSHPEMEGESAQEFLKEIANEKVVPIKCQCGADAVVNARYLKYIKGPISSCRLCR
jgi:hypothetical protein